MPKDNPFNDNPFDKKPGRDLYAVCYAMYPEVSAEPM